MCAGEVRDSYAHHSAKGKPIIADYHYTTPAWPGRGPFPHSWKRGEVVQNNLQVPAMPFLDTAKINTVLK